ncbi:MAG: type II toxin-antitoxin system RelE/ParE family toxin [Candidatus Lokiarchaeota archaeon]|nr:type II toxin-antitoxin system RelE/ParE family toxin [Candidatus Lokiarchaeota archaeon]MBD3198416.1 type II toxin-antitoxin system RelE/ParE family toxin [Candidatus Lokiarchaeota archaeon]
MIDYIAQDSIEYAVSFYEEVLKKVQDLITFPKMGRIVPELDDPNIREILLKNYRIIYKILEVKLQIVRVLHGSRILDFD